MAWSLNPVASHAIEPSPHALPCPRGPSQVTFMASRTGPQFHRLLGRVFMKGPLSCPALTDLFPPTPAGPSALGRPLQGPFQPFCWLLRARPLHSGPVLLGPDHHAQGPGSSYTLPCVPVGPVTGAQSGCEGGAGSSPSRKMCRFWNFPWGFSRGTGRLFSSPGD